MNGENLPPLDQLTKQEFRDRTRHLKEFTESEFDKLWAQFQKTKKLKGMH